MSTKTPGDLPHFRSTERFAVVDAGNGLVGLHNAKTNRFMKMAGENMKASPIKSPAHLPTTWDSEVFRIVDAGDGMVGLHSTRHNRFVRMGPDGIVNSWPRNWNDMPTHWTNERFYMVPVSSYLQPGTMVGLYLGYLVT